MDTSAHEAGNSRLRLGVVSFLNSRPLIDGLEDDPRIELRFAVPAALPGLLSENLVDAALIPVIDLARSAGRWRRVSDACIASDGRTLTVRVFSKVPPERMEVLHVDGDSHTSVALSRIIWANVYHRQLRIEPMVEPERLKDCESVLLIGDKVATTPMLWFDHQVDLGDAWKKWTGLPFVFATWVGPSEPRPGAFPQAEIGRLLGEARDRGVARAEAIARQFAASRGWPVTLAVEYLTHALMFNVTPAAQAGMNRFFDLLSESGIVPKAGGCSA
jgi:chorismate dehydratase